RPRKTYDFGGSSIWDAPPPGEPPAGTLDKHYIKSRIGEIVPLLAECYQLALARDRVLAGTLVVDFIIDAEEEVGGYVREAIIVPDESTLVDPELHECVVETIY